MAQVKMILIGMGRGVIIGRCGRKGDLIPPRCNSIEVDLGDLRPEDNIFGVVGCDRALRLHLTETEFPHAT